MPLRVVFFGTPEFAVPSLETLAADGQSIVGVVTQPDRPRGRGQHVQPSEVKEAALRLQAPILQPAQLKDAAFLQRFKELGADLGVVAAYGRILPSEVLAIPRLGMINVHASLLPRWRGAAPVHRAILEGDEVSGVTIMRVVQKLDAGPMLAQTATPISLDETSEALERRLATLGAELLVKTVRALTSGHVNQSPQDETLVTYASRLDKSDSQVNWARPALAIHNQIRGLQPWPLAAVRLYRKRLLLRASVPLPQESHSETPGTIIRADRTGLIVASQPGAVQVTILQLEGRPPMDVAAFLNGHRVIAGDRLEP